MTATVTAMARPDPTPLEVLQAGDCSARCLLSGAPTGRCTCRCGGLYHGVLYDVISKWQIGNTPPRPAGRAR